MEILYSDREIIVCVKPVGLDSELEVPAALKEQLGGEIFPIHRLDKNVGGVRVFARTKQAAANLSKAVQEGTMVKEYVAMVHGTPPESGDWTDLLFKDSSKNKVFVVKHLDVCARFGLHKHKIIFNAHIIQAAFDIFSRASAEDSHRNGFSAKAFNNL